MCALDLYYSTLDDVVFINNKEGQAEKMPFDKPALYTSINPGGSYALVINADKEIELYNTDNKLADRYTQQFKNKGESVKYLSVSWELLKLVVVWSDNSIKTQDLADGQEGYVLGSIKSDDNIIAFDSNGR